MHETAEYPHELGCPKSVGKSPNLSEKLSAECELLGEMPKYVGAGFGKRVESAVSNMPATTAEAACFAVAGCAVGLIARNPVLLGESCVPIITSASRWAPPMFAGMMGADFAGKTVGPIVQVWNEPSRLPNIKIEMGDKLGATAFDYSLSGIAGGAGGAFAAPAERALTSAASLRPIGQPQFAVASLEIHEPHASHSSTTNESEFVALSKRWEQGNAPQRIAISSRIFSSKDLSSYPYQNGDLWLGVVKTRIGEGLRFVTNVYSERVIEWKNADFWHPAVRQLYHGINEFHIGLKKEAMQNFLRSQEGRVLPWEDNFADKEWSGYKLGHTEFSQRLAIFESPELLFVSDRVYRGVEPPLASAKCIPEPGTVWLKYVVESKHGTKLGGRIIGRIFDGSEWKPLQLEKTFGSRRLRFDSLKEADIIATGLQADLRVNRTLARAVRDGRRLIGYALK